MSELERLEKELEKAVEELEETRIRIPAHTIRPWQIQELEDAEEKVRALTEKIAEIKK